MAEDKKLEKFIATINADAKSEGSALEAELERRRSAYLSAADDELLEEVYAYIRNATSRIRSEAGRRVSQKMFEQKRELHRCRQEIRDEVVSEARRKVEAFVETPDYGAALEKLALYADKRLGGEDMTIYLRPEDNERYGDRISGIARCRVTAGEVELGGLVAVNPRRKLRLDLSYDTSLQKAAEDFSKPAASEV